jgi:hypothetical protein
MIDDRDVWQAVTVLLVKRYRDDAMLEASPRARRGRHGRRRDVAPNPERNQAAAGEGAGVPAVSDGRKSNRPVNLGKVRRRGGALS